MACLSGVLRGEGQPHKKDGPWAWVVLVCVFITTWLSGGVGYSFGVFLPVLMDEFNETREKAALVGSLQFATFLCLIVVSSQLCDRFGCRIICAIGHAISAVGFVLSSFPQTILPMYFSHSLITAFGSSCIQGAGYLIIGKYFKQQRSLAVGIVASSVGVGAICWGPLAQFLLDIMSWRNIFRLIAGLYVLLSVLTITYDPNVEKDNEELERMRDGPERRSFLKKVFDLSIWKVPLYSIAVLSNMVACFGHHTAQIHVIKFALENGVSADKASTLFVFFGGTSVLARILAGRMCDYKAIKPNYVNQAAEVISGISTILLTQAKTYTHLVVFSIFYGIADGGFRTTLNVLFLNSVGPARMASAFGQGNMMISFFTASGPAVAGLLADHFDSYIPAFYMAGSVTILGSLVYMSLLCVKTEPTTDQRAQVAPLPQENVSLNNNAEYKASSNGTVEVELGITSTQVDQVCMNGFVDHGVIVPQGDHIYSKENIVCKDDSEEGLVTSLPKDDACANEKSVGSEPVNQCLMAPQGDHLSSNENIACKHSEVNIATSPQEDHVVSETNLACDGTDEDTKL